MSLLPVRVFLKLSLVLSIGFSGINLNILAQAPEWFLATTNLDEQSGLLFGKGTGTNITTAENNAYADLAGFLSTEVNAVTRSTVGIERGETTKKSSNFKQQVNTKARKLKISGLMLDKSIQVDGIYYVRFAISGKKLAFMQLDIINKANAAFDSFLNAKSADFQTMFDQLQKLPDEQEAFEAIELAEILAAISAKLAFLNIKSAADTFKANHSKYLEIIKKYPLKITLLNNALIAFASEVSSVLAKQGFRITKVGTSNTAELKINGSIAEAKFSTAEVATVVINFSLIADDNILALKSDQVHSVSPFSQADAVNKAAAKWSASLPSVNFLNYLNDEAN